MRTLLNEVLPPHFNDEPTFPVPQKIQRLRRIFSENTVLSHSEPMEVGVDGAVIATSGAAADPANHAPERGLTSSRAGAEQLNESPAL